MGYYSIYSLINTGLSSWGQNDVLFKYLNLLIPNFFLFIALISLFYILVIYYMIKENLGIKQYWFATLLLLINPYLFLIHLSAIRQTLAICFFILAVNSASKRKLVMYIVFILLAVGMHPSAIILFPFYFIINEKKIRKKSIVAIFLVLIVLITTPLFDLVTLKILEYLPQHYMYYYEQGLQNSLRSTMISVFFFLLVIFNINKLEGKEIIYGKLSLLATIISLFVIKVSMISRVGMYFDVFLIISIPQIFNRIEKKLYRQILFILLITIYVLRYYSFFINPLWESYVNYKTILGR